MKAHALNLHKIIVLKFCRETRRKYIKQKYENHKFVLNKLSNKEKIIKLLKNLEDNEPKDLFDSLLNFFGQNFDLLAPIDQDVNNETEVGKYI